MFRSLYRCVLRLHPPAFRQRFADEMLSIFDQGAGKPAAAKLLIDGVLSLVRQWTLRPEFWRDLSSTAQPAPDGIPTFYTIEPFRPRAGAVINGLMLSIAVFCLTCFAIRYSWIHVLHVSIPEVAFDKPAPMQPDSGAATSGRLQRPVVPQRSQAEPAIAPSVAPGPSAPGPSAPGSSAQESSVPARSRPANNADNQNRASLSSAAPVASEDAATSGAKTHTRLLKKSARSPEVSQSTPIAQARLQPDPGIVADEPRAQQLISPDAASAAIRADAEDVKLDAAARHRVISGAVADLRKYYVDPDVAAKMSESLLAHEKNGDDDAATDGEAFAGLLTTQMRDVSHDRYLMMVYSTVPAPENPTAPSREEVALYRKEMERTNCSIEKVTILPHNIGYLKFNAFPDASICGAKLAAAMASLNHADALIFDVRDNPGGYANMVALIATYLFDRPTHLNDFYDRSQNSTDQSWTLPPVPGNQLADKPVFVLTSHSTFSAAEGFSYDLKMLKRATLVGETTSGRGHMGMGHRIDDHFTIRVPGMRVVNPISKTNWEGTGVEPDVKVNAADALKTALKLAEQKLQTN
ncbi:MAG: S41 family peptidase [Candidatus Sulfotelmatobacter sp.]